RARQIELGRQTLDRVRRVRIHEAVAFRVRAVRRLEDLLRRFEFRQQAVDRRLSSHLSSSWACVPRNRARTSAVAIIGSRRMNTRNDTKKRPIVPKKVA